jgi:hypothetical protein
MSIAESFGQSTFARFVNSPSGRLARLVAGMAFITWGYVQRDSASGLIFIVAGLVPLAAGAFDLCFISAILGGPISGSGIRHRTP